MDKLRIAYDQALERLDLRISESMRMIDDLEIESNLTIALQGGLQPMESDEAFEGLTQREKFTQLCVRIGASCLSAKVLKAAMQRESEESAASGSPDEEALAFRKLSQTLAAMVGMISLAIDNGTITSDFIGKSVLDAVGPSQDVQEKLARELADPHQARAAYIDIARRIGMIYPVICRYYRTTGNTPDGMIKMQFREQAVSDIQPSAN